MWGKLVSSVFAERMMVFVALNWLFFCFIVLGAFLADTGFVKVVEVPFERKPLDVEGSLDYFSMFLFTFVFNLFLSGFLLLTVTGAIFFPLSFGFLLFRGFLWGVLLYNLDVSAFLAVLPTIVLEGEAYVFAALAGFLLGLSWLKPKWVYGDEQLSRGDSFRRAVGECKELYLMVIILLLVAAAVETATIAVTGF